MLTGRCWHGFLWSRSPHVAWTLQVSISLCLLSLLPFALAQEAGAQTGSGRQLPEHRPANVMSLQGIVRDQQGRAVPGVHLDLHNASGAHYETSTGAEGIFRLRDVELGTYKLTLEKPGFKTLAIDRLELVKRELSTLELQMQALTAPAPENKGPSGLPGTPRTPVAAAPTAPYPGMNHPAPEVAAAEPGAEPVPPESANFSPKPDRWDIAMPEWRRYEHATRRAVRQGPLVRSVQSQPAQGRLSHLRTTLVFQLHRHQRNRRGWPPAAAAQRCGHRASGQRRFLRTRRAGLAYAEPAFLFRPLPRRHFSFARSIFACASHRRSISTSCRPANAAS